MKSQPRTPEETYGPALIKAQAEFPKVDPKETAARAAVGYENGVFQVPFFGKLHDVQWPAATVSRASDGTEPDIATRILLLHYLLAADGTPLAADWIAFRNLPGGLGYDAAFQGRANLRLARTFGKNLSAFEAAARSIGGEQLIFGDASYSFRAFPRVWLAVVLHLADEEFPASANVLFDASASHYLPTEDLAVLGGIVAGQLIKSGSSK